MTIQLRHGAGAIATAILTFVTVASVAAQAQPLPEAARTIRVSGVGEIRAVPDMATVQFAVETTGLTAQDAGQSNADQMDRVVQALIRAGVTRQDIQTSGYSVYPEYAMQRGGELDPPRITGYRATNQVGVRTRQLTQVGTLIDAGLAAGANRLNGVGFELKDSQAAEAQALTLAVQNATTSARTMATALGVTLGSILDASTNSDPPQPMFRAYARDAMAMEGAAMATPIEPGEQTVRASASLVFEIEGAN